MADSYYALEKFKELKMNLDNISETMPIKRKAVKIYTQKNQINRAKDTFSELEAIKENLSEVIKELRLLFSECDMQKGAEYANRLYGAVGCCFLYRDNVLPHNRQRLALDNGS